MRRNKGMLPAMAIAAAATMVCAHLPSMYDARFQIDKERELKGKAVLQQREKRGQTRFGKFSTWDATKTYAGDYTKYQGDTVQHKKDEYGNNLYWWAKFYAAGDEPGALGEGGGTSPWVLINSYSMSKNGRVDYQWSGWDGSIPNGQAKVATWRYGAKGAYSFTHDDIGSMPFSKAIFPAYELAKEQGFEEIKTSWGVFVREMDESTWENALAMVKDGHEMFNHSWDHTSAADQYQWFYPKTTVPAFDPSIPYEIRGLTVVGLWGDPSGNMNWPAPGTLKLENDLITVESTNGDQVYWTQNAFRSGAEGLKITTKTGTEAINVNGKTLYVQYTHKDNWAGAPTDGSADIKNEGFISAADAGWFDLNQLKTYGEKGWNEHTKNAENNWWVNPADVPAGCTQTDWSDGGKDPTGNCSGKNPCDVKKPCQADQGAPGMLVKVFTVKAWTSEEFTKNMRDANVEINRQIYEKIENPGKFFIKGKRCEYFGYPFDAYSLETHQKLNSYGIYQARGGSKTPQVMKGDFFHPYAIDFDAFYITKKEWTAANGGAGWVYPDNPHVWLGLNQMVDSIIYHKGYMIREFHAVADIPDGEWYLDANGKYNENESNSWVLNSPSAARGGWWGGITKNQLRVHYQYLKQKIDAGDLVVFTPSEAVKYRLTANATSNPVLTQSGQNYTLRATTDGTKMHEQQRDEISVIVGIDATDKLNVEYTSGGNPRLAPRKLNSNGSAWAVNFNPFVGEVKLIRGQDFNEPEWKGPDVSVDGSGGDEECDPFLNPTANPCVPIAKVSKRTNGLAFTGIQNGQINLRLNAGNYTAELYNLQGRLVARQNINAVNGVNATGLRTNNLSKGMFILNVKQAGASVLQHKIMIK